MGQRFGNVFHQIEQKVRRPEQHMIAERRAEQFVDPAAESLHRDAEIDHQQPDGQGKRKSRIDVGCRDAAPVMQVQYVLVEPGHDIHWKEIHGVHEQHPHEHGQRRRRDELVAVAVKYPLDLFVHEFHGKLDKGLALAGDAGGCTAHYPPEKSEAQDTEQNGHHQRVDVQNPKIALAHRRCHVRQVVRNIFSRGQFVIGSHRYALALYVAYEKRHREHQDRKNKRSDEYDEHHILI